MLLTSCLVNTIIAFLCLATVTSALWGSPVTPEAQQDLPSWAQKNTLQLKLSVDSTNYAVIPLTKHLALNGSDSERGIVQLNGHIKAVRNESYKSINNAEDVAYMSCDNVANYNAYDRTMITNDLMNANPKAIILYSTVSNWCSIQEDGGLPYTSFLSMVDPAEAIAVLNHLNSTDKGEVVDISIYGNTTNMDPDPEAKGPKSAVAMSVLYSITGIITLLFLVIIVTGAVRAHRYPDRYGPRRDGHGRPRQSRAKGLARAVLETLPIVKFGDQHQAKSDPVVAMENANMDDQGAPVLVQRAVSPARDRRSNQVTRDSVSVHDGAADERTEIIPPNTSLGCSICTEDFKVGEDVRVLPCKHQFHPTCVDPWLINVSGTCPLCRLDLRPGKTEAEGPLNSIEGVTTLPPPLSLEAGEELGAHPSYRNRLSRLFNIHQLRHASVEEQMEALRRLREDRIARDAPEANAQGTEEEEEEARYRGARFTAKLRDKFRILTRSQPEQRQQC